VLAAARRAVTNDSKDRIALSTLPAGGSAMERRRYIPPSLGVQAELETRQLMSATPATPPTFIVPPPSDYNLAYYKQINKGVKKGSPLGNAFGSTTVAPDLPPTIPIRLKRIENLPFILHAFEQTRALPSSVMAPIQEDLRATLALLTPPNSTVLNEFNRVIRDLDPTHNLPQPQATKLLAAFDNVLKGSGMSDALRVKFIADMKALAALDATGPEPSIQAVNDFAIISQLVQSVGQPIPAPEAPQVLPAELLHNTHTTGSRQPTFVGTVSPDIEVVITLVNGGIIASGLADSTGAYSVKSTYTLPDGTYLAKASTFDDGYFSLQSKSFRFQVVTTPKEKAAAAPASAVPRGPHH
jgi:hypothetical protein